MLNYFSYFNTQGLYPKTKDSKVSFIKDILVDKDQLFIGLTETWLKDNLDAELQINGYNLFETQVLLIDVLQCDHLVWSVSDYDDQVFGI